MVLCDLCPIRTDSVDSGRNGSKRVRSTDGKGHALQKIVSWPIRLTRDDSGWRYDSCDNLIISSSLPMDKSPRWSAGRSGTTAQRMETQPLASMCGIDFAMMRLGAMIEVLVVALLAYQESKRVCC